MKEFIIDHIDPLGQGVFKEDEKIYFIPKTLPGESGTFEVKKSSKGVHFGQLKDLSKTSPDRIQAECKFFEKCGGCQFQHTSFENETSIKLQSFKRTLSKLNIVDLQVNIIKDHNRFQYRNRVQVHYDLNQKKLGFFQVRSKNIIEIDKCLLIDPTLQEHFSALISNDYWIKEAQKYKILFL